MVLAPLACPVLPGPLTPAKAVHAALSAVLRPGDEYMAEMHRQRESGVKGLPCGAGGNTTRKQVADGAGVSYADLSTFSVASAERSTGWGKRRWAAAHPAVCSWQWDRVHPDDRIQSFYSKLHEWLSSRDPDSATAVAARAAAAAKEKAVEAQEAVDAILVDKVKELAQASDFETLTMKGARERIFLSRRSFFEGLALTADLSPHRERIKQLVIEQMQARQPFDYPLATAKPSQRAQPAGPTCTACGGGGGPLCLFDNILSTGAGLPRIQLHRRCCVGKYQTLSAAKIKQKHGGGKAVLQALVRQSACSRDACLPERLSDALLCRRPFGAHTTGKARSTWCQSSRRLSRPSNPWSQRASLRRWTRSSRACWRATVRPPSRS